MNASHIASKKHHQIGWVMSSIVILFMLIDSIFKFTQPVEVVEGTVVLGYGEHQIMTIGTLGLLSIVMYAFSRTSILGAILLTAYFGGAIATHVRLENPLFSHILFPVYLAILAWGGLWMRDKRLRHVIPFLTKP